MPVLEEPTRAPIPAASAKSGRIDAWKAAQIAIVSGMAALAVWQLARVGFDWRMALEGASPWTFFLAMATLPVFGFPISACYLYAGLAFEPVPAIAACLGGLCVNLSASYALTRGVFRRPIERLIARRGWKLPALREENQFRWVFALRTIPGPPFFFQNLAISLVGVPFGLYLWVSLLGQGAIAVGMVLGARAVSTDPGGLATWSLVCIAAALVTAKLVRQLLASKARRKAAAISGEKT